MNIKKETLSNCFMRAGECWEFYRRTRSWRRKFFLIVLFSLVWCDMNINSWWTPAKFFIKKKIGNVPVTNKVLSLETIIDNQCRERKEKQRRWRGSITYNNHAENMCRFRHFKDNRNLFLLYTGSRRHNIRTNQYIRNFCF